MKWLVEVNLGRLLIVLEVVRLFALHEEVALLENKGQERGNVVLPREDDLADSEVAIATH
jgi:hypothetical protein